MRSRMLEMHPIVFTGFEPKLRWLYRAALQQVRKGEMEGGDGVGTPHFKPDYALACLRIKVCTAY